MRGVGWWGCSDQMSTFPSATNRPGHGESAEEVRRNEAYWANGQGVTLAGQQQYLKFGSLTTFEGCNLQKFFSVSRMEEVR
jgi:hypothetical protein